MSFDKMKVAKKAIQHVKAWSYSSLRSFETCPARFEREKILKEFSPRSPILERGIKIHSELEAFVRSSKPVSPELVEAESALVGLMEHYDLIPEAEWAYTKDWQRCGWFDGVAWLRAKIDLHYYQHPQKLVVIDYKSGAHGKADDYSEQVELYTLAGFLANEIVTEVETQLWFVDGAISKVAFPPVTRNDLPELANRWQVRSRKIFDCDAYAPNPGRHCGGCYFSAANKGPCVAGGRVPMWKTYYQKHGGIEFK